jgi:hypothetical protein
MGWVRPFGEGDVPRVVDLHRRVFPVGSESPRVELDEYRDYCRETFLNNPWSDAGPVSLVYEESDGDVVGFLGVMARQLSLDGRPVQLAISSQFMVEPTRRATLAAVHLVRALQLGPQDLLVADEASDASRTLWEALGGSTAHLYSLCWVRPLRPGRFIASRLMKRSGLAARVWGPLCDVIDGAAARLSRSPLYQSEPDLAGEELDEAALAACISDLPRRSLRPEYDSRSLKWLFEVLAQKKGCGTFRKVAVRNAMQEVVGWYLYYAKPGEVGEVIQVGARDDSVAPVLRHLFYHAWRQGLIGLVGRADPKFLREYSRAGCFFHHRGHWMLIHSRRPEVLRALQAGDAFLTRLEGEWCMRLRGAYA